MTRSSTPNSFLHFSADKSISFAFATSNFRARRNLRGDHQLAIGCGEAHDELEDGVQCLPEKGRIIHALWHEMTLVLQLFLERIECELLRSGEVAQPPRQGLVVWIGDAGWDWTDVDPRCRGHRWRREWELWWWGQWRQLCYVGLRIDNQTRPHRCLQVIIIAYVDMDTGNKDYTTVPAFAAIRGHKSAWGLGQSSPSVDDQTLTHSFATGPTMTEPFMSPLLLTITPALSCACDQPCQRDDCLRTSK